VQAPWPVHLSVVQASPSSQDAVAQQIPSTQLLFVQTNPLLHALPLGSFWQVPLTQLFPPFGSAEPGAKELQSALVEEQSVLHVALLASHWNFPQGLTVPGSQVPAPLQVGAEIAAKDSAAPPLETAGAQAAVPQENPAAAS
jgi:hypothetical protein